MGRNCIDYSTLTVTSTPLTLHDNCSPVRPTQAKGCIITVETDQVRWRADGTSPTTSEGHLLSSGDILTFNSWSDNINWISVLLKIEFIRVTNDAKLKINWFD